MRTAGQSKIRPSRAKPGTSHTLVWMDLNSIKCIKITTCKTLAHEARHKLLQCGQKHTCHLFHRNLLTLRKKLGALLPPYQSLIRRSPTLHPKAVACLLLP